MPKAQEKRLKAKARKIGLTGDRFNAYVYGSLRETGWVPSVQRKTKEILDGLKKKRRS